MAEETPSTTDSRTVGRHQIRDVLQQMILDGRHRPGEKLVQQQLARQFGVAQGVVREALLELKAYGLVDTIDNRGVFVSDLNIQRLLDSFDVREMNEGLAARLCCDRVTRTDLRDLTELARAACLRGKQGKLMEMASLDRKFHTQLVRLSGNSMLVRLATNYRVLGKVIQLTRDPDEVLAEHLSVLKAIEEGQPDDAERLMRAHIRTGKRSLEQEVARGSY